MLRNYCLVALRNLWRHKGFSFLNISGLAIGMASAILILLWISDELGYDRFHPQLDRLYQVWGNNLSDGGLQSGVATPEMMGPVIQQEIPEVAQTARIGWNQQLLFAYGDQRLKADGAWADPAFLTMFRFPLLQGQAATVLNDPYAVGLTQQMAYKLFGKVNPMGKSIRVDNELTFTVTGVLKDLPPNTQFDFEFLLSSELKRVKGYFDTDWTNVSIRTFALLKPHTRPQAVATRLKPLVAKHSGGRATSTYFLYPVSQLRLYSDFRNGQPVGGRIETVRVFALIAGFILLIACINFTNLSTARSERRAKEVGIRKVVGARKQSLVVQFLSESLLMALISGVLALTMVQLSLPSFNRLTEKQLHVEYGNPAYWLASLAFVLLTGLLAGSYPTFFLSAFRPVAVLKGTFRQVHALVTPRQVLVVLQFTFAIVLIIGTLIIRRQIHYAQDRQAGYEKNNLIYVFIEGDTRKHYELIRNELLNSGAVTAISKTLSPLTQVWSSGHSLSWQGKNPNAPVSFIRTGTDGGLVKTAGLQLVQGRDIDVQQYPTDSTACLINEAAARVLKFGNPIGQTIFDDSTSWHIVGVVKDFIIESPYHPIKPLIVKGPKYGFNVIHLKLNSQQPTGRNLARVEQVFKHYNPGYPFEYHFLDEEYARKFSNEQLTGTLATLFTGLTIFISCLGLFGLAASVAESRVKEIGIRKVLGASVASVTVLLSGGFLQLVGAAILVASPVAYWLMREWLSGFEYRIGIGWEVFAVAGLLASLIALLTVGYQAIKATTANPIKALRTE